MNMDSSKTCPILPSEWAAKHYTGDDWPVIKGAGIELECAGADRQQAEAIAAILNIATAPEQAGLSEGCGLPLLPFTARSTKEDGGLYTTDDMQDYARAAYAMGRASAVHDYVNLNDAALAARQAAPAPTAKRE